MPPPAANSQSISGFDPRSVTGCQLWLDASDTSTLTGSSPVTSWRNKIVPSNNVPVFATGAGSPSISATAINGRQAMYFNGSSYFTGAISAASSTTITVFIVGSLISPFTGFSGLLCFGNASQLDYDNVGSLPITMYNANFAIYGARNSSSQITPISANVPFLYVLQYDGAYINTWLNGTQQTDPSINIASSGTFTYTNYSVAARAGTIVGQYLWSGYFGEILVYQTAVNTTDRQRIEGYLAWKWGIESMPFIPSNISGLAMWLDGADQSTLFTDTSATTAVTADGNLIASWRDKSTNAYLFTQATSGNRPTYKTSILNGRSITRFNGTSTFLQSSATLPFYTSSTSGGSFFVVFMATTVTSQRFLMTYQNQVTNTYCGGESELGYTTGNGGQGNFGFHQGCSKATVAATGTIVTNSYVLMSYVLATTGTTPANSTIFKNGISLTPANDQTGFYSAGSYPSANNSRYLNIGARIFNGSQATDCWHSGDIAEIIWYQTPLSTTDRQGIESYLSKKWNISVPTQALPLTHAFVITRPFSRQFSPIDIPECLFWWDAADGSTITRSGTQVTSWRNKGSWDGSAVSRVGVVTSGTATYNGLNIVQFPVGTELGFTVAIPNQARAWFAVFKQTTQVTVSGPNFTQYFAIINQTQGSGQDSAFGPGVPTTQGTTSYILSEGPSGNPNGVSTGNTVPDGYNVMKQYAWINSATSTASNFQTVNGTSYTLTTNNTATAYRTDSVTYTINTNWYNNSCDLAEIIFYNSEISVSQRQQIEGYLANKWGLQSSLIAGHPYTKLPPSSVIPFLPTNLSGCKLWLDGADPAGTGVTPANGGTITAWIDKSTNNVSSAITGTLTYQASFANNNGSIKFSGTQYIQNTTFTLGLSTKTFFMVCSSYAATTNGSPAGYIYFGNVGNVYDQQNGTAYQGPESGFNNKFGFLQGYTNGGYYTSYGGTAGETPLGIYGDTQNSTSAVLYVNGSILATNTLSYTPGLATGFRIGKRSDNLGGSAYNLYGNICEIIVYNVVLTTYQRQKVEGYLAAKWGLSYTLPTIHPYRKFEPTQESYIPVVAPGAPTLNAPTNTTTTLNMSWSAGSGGTPVTYTVTVYAAGVLVTGSGGTQTISHPTTSTTFSPMISGTAYTFYVSATNTGGTSATAGPSSSVTYTASSGGITVVGTNTAGNMSAAANTVGGFAGVDDGGGAITTNLTLFGTNYTTMYVGTNGYITPGFANSYSTSPSASFPGGVAIHVRPYDARGINATWSQGYSSVTTTAQYTRIVGDWYPYYGTYAGDIQAEIYLVRDATNSKQFIWIKIGSGYNNNGNSDTYWGITNGSSHVTGTSFPGVGGSVVFSSDLTGNSWTTTLPGSLSGF
jgi:Fibronectin type III domain